MSKYAGKLITAGTTGGYSVQFPGVTTAYLETPWNAAFTFGSGNWTIEAWIYPTNTSTDVAIISNWTATAGQFQLRRTAANRLEFIYNLNGTTQTTTGDTGFILPDRWTHVCARRNSSTLTVSIDGVQSSAVNIGANAVANTGQVIRVGVEGATVNPFLGFISNARIVVGTAIYPTNNFNVPMILDPAVSGTQYLTCASPLFVDLSGNNFTVTRAGTVPVFPRISTFTPYGGQSPLTSIPALGRGPAGIYRSSDMATYSVNRATSAYDPYFNRVRTLLHGSGWNGTSNRGYGATQNFSSTAATSTSSSISGNNLLTIGGTVTGTFSIGTTVTGTGVKDGAVIVGYGTGTGGAGTYQLSGVYPTVSSIAINGDGGGYVTTATGAISQGSFSPFSSSGWSLNNDNATNSYVDTGASANFSLGTGDYTIEFWVMFPVTALTASKYLIDMRGGTGGTGPSIIVNGSSQIELNGILSTGFLPSRYRWYHYALCRSGGTVRWYVNGSQVASVANATNYNIATPFTRFVAAGDVTTPTNFTNVSLSNVRIIKGQALYTGGFTPSKFPFTNKTVGSTGTGAARQITGIVALITFQDGRFKDNSGNNLAVTPIGNTNTARARLLTYAPLYPVKVVSPGSTGGSIYFPGGAAYLTVAGANTNCAFGTGDFTIECWIYPLSTAAVQLFFDTMGGTTTGRVTLQYETNQSVSVTYNAGSNFLTSTAGTAPLYAWTHVYLGRVSGTSYLFINGVQQSTTTTNPSFICDANRPVLGTNGSSLGSDSFTGYISGLRITRVSLGTTTVPTVPPQMVEYTALLMNGADGAVDDSVGSNNFQMAGATTLSIATQGLPLTGGSGVMVFNGTTDYLQASDPALLTPVGEWTVEAWIYSTSFAAIQTVFQVNGNNNTYAMCRLDIGTTGTLNLLVSGTGSSHVINVTSTLTITTNRWTHIAIVRTGGFIYVFANGVLYVTGAQNALNTLVANPSLTRIGALLGAAGATTSQYFVGRMSDIRVTQAARYTSPGFTLPNSPFQDM
jgi:hypothetical protein